MSATYVVPVKNWAMELADILEMGQDGDTVVCASEAQKELAERALSRMAPGKKLNLTVECEIGQGAR